MPIRYMQKVAKTLIREKFLNPVFQKTEKIIVLDHENSLRLHKETYGTHINYGDEKLVSSICRPTDILRYSKWIPYLRKCPIQVDVTAKDDLSIFHCKIWELIYIMQALSERNQLVEGKKGLVFAVGTEPLPAIFASFGCKILASDLDPNLGLSGEWEISNQHANNRDILHYPNLCELEKFNNNVDFEYIDMNDIPEHIKGFDFCWSSCAFEHLGSIEKGLEFVHNMLKCLKPGGFAVHTTEFNLSSDTDTLDNPSLSTVLFRKSDFQRLYNDLTEEGHYVEPLDFRLDDSKLDEKISIVPLDAGYHFKSSIRGYLSTPFGLIIQKKYN